MSDSESRTLGQLKALAQLGFIVTMMREDVHILERYSGTFVLQARWAAREDRVSLWIGYRGPEDKPVALRPCRLPEDPARQAESFLRIVESPPCRWVG